MDKQQGSNQGKKNDADRKAFRNSFIIVLDYLTYFKIKISKNLNIWTFLNLFFLSEDVNSHHKRYY